MAKDISRDRVARWRKENPEADAEIRARHYARYLIKRYGERVFEFVLKIKVKDEEEEK